MNDANADLEREIQARVAYTLRTRPEFQAMSPEDVGALVGTNIVLLKLHSDFSASTNTARAVLSSVMRDMGVELWHLL
jgi:hypothetical protein